MWTKRIFTRMTTLHALDLRKSTSFHAPQRKYKIAREQKAAVPIAFTIKHVLRAVCIYARIP